MRQQSNKIIVWITVMYDKKNRKDKNLYLELTCKLYALFYKTFYKIIYRLLEEVF